MSLYTNKQRWKRVLLGVAGLIVVATLGYSNHIAERIRQEEKRKVAMWSKAIQQRAALVSYTQTLFEELEAEERMKADRLAQAYQILTHPEGYEDLSFVTGFVWSNTSIPVVVYNGKGDYQFRVNVPEEWDSDSLRLAMARAHKPIVFEGEGTTVYWSESVRLSELKRVMGDLIGSFISETVINSASVPVILMDSTQSRAVRFQGVDSSVVADAVRLRQRLELMESQNEPIVVDLPLEGKHFVYYEDSVVLKQLRYFPLVQLILIGVFLVVAYLIFNSYRRSEQNQVWVGMAKETAHQLGTPMSSLMAWVGLLEQEGVNPEYLREMNKDVERLNTVVDRFSKIGSDPKLTQEELGAVVASTVDYMRPRIGGRVRLSFVDRSEGCRVALSVPLISWVLENLIRNAVDAMEGEGEVAVLLHRVPEGWAVDVRDTGKGIPRAQWSEVFQPGFTTKARGWGLGLSLTKRIIEGVHKGKIFVLDSEVGSHTVFRVLMK